ncbi:MAG: hypothetical protein DMD79_07665 [Candidatus Rokuibacteriota bacterium]|nr:MAG: hypothetical protein DMD79_07665 [Candidatus Rokubacteria bacterium]
MHDLLVRYRKYSLLAVVLLVGVSLLTLQRARPDDGSWLADGIAFVTAPLQTGAARLHRGAVTLWTTYLDWKALRAEVVRLRTESTALRLRQLRQAELENENQRLRGLVTLHDRLATRTVGAEVVAREWNGFTRGLTIGRGRVDGIDRLAPVVVARGVVGRVAVLRRSSAVVQLLTDPASSIGAIVHGTRAQGLVEGVAGGRLRRCCGDLVYTSGIGELFPKGLPLGRVLRVYPPAGLFRTAEIEPAVDLATVEEVLVLSRGTTADLGAAFP